MLVDVKKEVIVNKTYELGLYNVSVTIINGNFRNAYLWQDNDLTTFAILALDDLKAILGLFHQAYEDIMIENQT